MTVEFMSVIDADNNNLRLNTRNQQHCQRCDAKSGCGLQLLSDSFYRRKDILDLPVPDNVAGKVKPGDVIEVSIDANQLIRLSLLQYFFPIALVVIATALAEFVTGATAADEYRVILCAITALILGLIMVRYWSLTLADNIGAVLATELTESAKK